MTQISASNRNLNNKVLDVVLLAKNRQQAYSKVGSAVKLQPSHFISQKSNSDQQSSQKKYNYPFQKNIQTGINSFDRIQESIIFQYHQSNATNIVLIPLYILIIAIQPIAVFFSLSNLSYFTTIFVWIATEKGYQILKDNESENKLKVPLLTRVTQKNSPKIYSFGLGLSIILTHISISSLYYSIEQISSLSYIFASLFLAPQLYIHFTQSSTNKKGLLLLIILMILFLFQNFTLAQVFIFQTITMQLTSRLDTTPQIFLLTALVLIFLKCLYDIIYHSFQQNVFLLFWTTLLCLVGKYISRKGGQLIKYQLINYSYTQTTIVSLYPITTILFCVPFCILCQSSLLLVIICLGLLVMLFLTEQKITLGDSRLTDNLNSAYDINNK